jgi:hypothetical protein
VLKVAEGYGIDHVTTGVWSRKISQTGKWFFSQSLRSRNERKNIKIKKGKWKKNERKRKKRKLINVNIKGWFTTQRVKGVKITENFCKKQFVLKKYGYNRTSSLL